MANTVPVTLDDSILEVLFNGNETIPYNMTNDYMFRAVLQSNNKVLCGLIRSLLHLPENVPLTAEITNPILLGEQIEDKEFRLDINTLINNSTKLNLEMQVTNQLNWQNRSIIYLCRSFDEINHGADYSTIKPVIHIGFLDFSLFRHNLKFYSTYLLMEKDTHQIYSDNFDLRVVDLTQITLATDEDKAYQIDYWASLFKAKTWRDLKMFTEKNETIKEAAKALYYLSSDEAIQKRCRDREDYYSDIRSYQKAIAEKDNAIAKMGKAIIEKDNAIAEKDALIAQLQAQLDQLKK